MDVCVDGWQSRLTVLSKVMANELVKQTTVFYACAGVSPSPTLDVQAGSNSQGKVGTDFQFCSEADAPSKSC